MKKKKVKHYFFKVFILFEETDGQRQLPYAGSLLRHSEQTELDQPIKFPLGMARIQVPEPSHTSSQDVYWDQAQTHTLW